MKIRFFCGCVLYWSNKYAGARDGGLKCQINVRKYLLIHLEPPARNLLVVWIEQLNIATTPRFHNVSCVQYFNAAVSTNILKLLPRLNHFCSDFRNRNLQWIKLVHFKSGFFSLFYFSFRVCFNSERQNLAAQVGWEISFKSEARRESGSGRVQAISQPGKEPNA